MKHPDPKQTKRKKRKSTPKISKEVYDKMVRAYFERQTIAHVAKTAPVAYSTAKRYVQHGDPHRNLMSLEDRFALTNEQQRMQEDYDRAKMRTEVQTAARAMFRKVMVAIRDCDPQHLTTDKLVEQLAKVQGVLERTFGGADMVVENRQVIDISQKRTAIRQLARNPELLRDLDTILGDSDEG